MPITIDIVDERSESAITKVMDYFRKVDTQFSPFKEESEVSQINRRSLRPDKASPDMQEIIRRAEQTRKDKIL